MKIQRDRSIDNTRSKPRLSASKKAEISDLVRILREKLGTTIDREAHTVQIVFTGEKNETVITFTA